MHAFFHTKLCITFPLFPRFSQASIIDDVFPTHVTERLEQAMESLSGHKTNGASLSSSGAALAFNSAHHTPPGSSAHADLSSTQPIADFYPEATVLFSDIVSFTSWSSTVTPEKVFSLLECMFGTFDELARTNDCYKGARAGTSGHAPVNGRFRSY